MEDPAITVVVVVVTVIVVIVNVQVNSIVVVVAVVVVGNQIAVIKERPLFFLIASLVDYVLSILPEEVKAAATQNSDQEDGGEGNGAKNFQRHFSSKKR